MRFAPAALVLAVVSSLAAPSLVAAAPPVEHAIRQIQVEFRGVAGSKQTRTEAEARVIAQKARAALDAGKAFAEVSHAYNDNKGFDLAGGFVGFQTAAECDPAAWPAIAAARDGEILGPLKLETGYYVIQKVSAADAMATLVADSAVVRIAVFAWKGATQSRESRSKETALDNASSAITSLAQTQDFSKLPAVLGAVPFKGRNWRPVILRRGMQPPRLAAVETAAFALKEGEISAHPLETEFGWMVIGRTRYFRCFVAHLLVVHKGAPDGAGQGIRRNKEEARLRCAEALAKLRADPTSWARVVAEYSDETGTSRSEGMFPVAVEPDAGLESEFIDAVGRLAPGATSGLVETVYGWHIIRRLN